MTFINARILRKRPNLFVTPKRNYGNLLIKYEAGQNSSSASVAVLCNLVVVAGRGVVCPSSSVYPVDRS